MAKTRMPSQRTRKHERRESLPPKFATNDQISVVGIDSLHKHSRLDNFAQTKDGKSQLTISARRESTFGPAGDRDPEGVFEEAEQALRSALAVYTKNEIVDLVNSANDQEKKQLIKALIS